jgi:hypothetical protein
MNSPITIDGTPVITSARKLTDRPNALRALYSFR